MAAPTFKKATDAAAGDSTKYGAPDVKYAFDVLDGTHSTDRIQASNIETSGASNVQTDLDSKLSDITGQASTSLTDTANIAYLDGTNVFTAVNTFNDLELNDQDGTPVADRRLRTIDGFIRGTDNLNSEARCISKLSLEQITDTEVAAGAAIAYSKLNLTGAILDADLAGSITSAKLVGTDIATLGTITTGTWQGTAIASAFLDADTAHLTTAQTFTGVKTFQGQNTGDVVNSEFDVILGNTGAGQGGAIKFGAARLGFEVSTHLVSSLEVGGSVVLTNSGTPIGKSEFIFADSTGSLRLGIPKNAAGDGMYSPRSMIIAGPATLNDNVYTGTTWGFDRIAMDTDTDGADLGVQNDIQVLGDVFIGQTLYIKERAAAQADIAGYVQLWVKEGTPNTLWFTDDEGTDAQLGANVVGTQTKFIPAAALYTAGTSAANGPVTKIFGANSQPINAIEFPDGSDTYCYLDDVLENWDGGTIKVKLYWFRENDEATPETKTMEIEVSGVSLANFAAIGGTAYGTAVAVTDTTDGTTAEDKINITAASTAITIAGAGAGEWVSLRFMRDDSAGTMTGSLFLAGVGVEYTISGGTSTL